MQVDKVIVQQTVVVTIKQQPWWRHNQTCDGDTLCVLSREWNRQLSILKERPFGRCLQKSQCNGELDESRSETRSWLELQQEQTRANKGKEGQRRSIRANKGKQEQQGKTRANKGSRQVPQGQVKFLNPLVTKWVGEPDCNKGRRWEEHGWWGEI